MRGPKLGFPVVRRDDDGAGFDERDRCDRLTDADVLAILNSRGMGATFVSVAEYDRISDWDLLHVYLAPRDEETSDHITLRRRMLYAAGYAVSDGPEPEMPPDPAVELKIPREAMLAGVPMCWVAMFWRLARKRGKTDEEILAAFKAKIAEVPPAGMFA